MDLKNKHILKEGFSKNQFLKYKWPSKQLRLKIQIAKMELIVKM